MNRRNINIFYFLESLSALAAGMILPLYVVYFRHGRVSLLEVALLAAVFEATVLIFEVPTGFFADRFGRKNSTLTGFFLFSCSALIFYYCRSFWGFLVAEIIFGMAETFISGALEALAVESLDDEKNKASLEDKQAGLFANRTVFRTAAMLAGMLLAGIFAHDYLPYLFIPVLAAFLIALLLSFRLREIRKESSVTEGNKPESGGLLKFIMKSRFVLSLFVVGLLINFVYEGPDQYWQVLFNEIKSINPSVFGLLTAVGLLLVTFTARPLKKLYHKFGLYLSICLGLTAAALLVVVEFGLYPAIVGIVVYFMLKELLRPAISYQLNRRFAGANRATYLSFYNLVCSLGEVAAGVTAGVIAARFNIMVVFYVSVIFILFAGVLYILIGRTSIRQSSDAY